MTKNTKSPYASSFKSAIKRGTPCSTAVCNIAKRCNKTPNSVYNSLFKAGCVNRQKFNGQWCYWACCDGVKKSNATICKSVQCDMWQCFVDWCICSGCCTPEQMSKNCGSQKAFMNFCRKYFAKQFNTTSSTTTKKSTGRKTSSRKSTTKVGKTTSYKFPGVKGRKTRKAA